MSQSLSLRQNQPLGAPEWQMFQEQARFLVKGGLLPSAIKTPEQALTIMLQGFELNIGPLAALQTINVISGKPTVSPQLMLALIERSHEAEMIDIHDTNDAKKATVTMKRRGRAAHTSTFTIEDARALGLATRDNWQKQPAVMLQWRAVAACARVTFPDVILGLYTPEEMGADVVFTDTGEMTIAPEPFAVQVGDIPPTAASHARDLEAESTAEPGDIPFPDLAPVPVDPATLTHYNNLMREAGRRNATAASTNQPEPFDLAEWELLPGMSAEAVGSLRKRLQARLQEPTTAAV